LNGTLCFQSQDLGVSTFLCARYACLEGGASRVLHVFFKKYVLVYMYMYNVLSLGMHNSCECNNNMYSVYTLSFMLVHGRVGCEWAASQKLESRSKLTTEFFIASLSAPCCIK
jgi:hypothetical protein